jgi:hypothetical protein
MGEQHDARRRRVALDGRDQVAETVRAAPDADLVQHAGEAAAHPVLMAAEARDQHQLGQAGAQAVAHLSPAPPP